MASTEVAAEIQGQTKRDASDLSARLVGLGLGPGTDLDVSDLQVGSSTPSLGSGHASEHLSLILDATTAVVKTATTVDLNFSEPKPRDSSSPSFNDSSRPRDSPSFNSSKHPESTPFDGSNPPKPRSSPSFNDSKPLEPTSFIGSRPRESSAPTNSSKLRESTPPSFNESPSPRVTPLRRYSSNIDSTPSIKSLRDIPCVDQTLDSAFVSDRYSFRSAPYNSTPSRNGDHKRTSVHSVASQNAKNTAQELFVKEVAPTEPTDADAIAKLHAVVNELNDRTESWTSVTMASVISACETGRQAQSLANSISAFPPLASTDPAAFANQYHQLRGTYASSTPSEAPPTQAKAHLSWEHRQLVDSFVTLLRTSPGFVASAYSRLGSQAASQFCSSVESSTLSVLFSNVLGCAPKNRIAFFAEVIDTLWYIERPTNTIQNRLMIVQSILERILMTSLGTLSKEVHVVLHRFFLQFLKGSRPDIRPLLEKLLPDGFLGFVSWLPDGTEETVAQCVQDFLSSVLLCPYRYNSLTDIYLSEKARQQLSDFAEVSRHEVQALLEGKKDALADAIGNIWEPDTLVVLRGSEITSLYHALLPTPASIDDGLDEWCLDNIRSDLLPVIREMMHVPGHSTSWQVFKLGSDGLAADLRGELAGHPDSSGQARDMEPDYSLELLAAKAKEGMPMSEVIEAAMESAELTGDHLVQYSLLTLASDDKLAEKCVDYLNKKLGVLQSREANVTNILNTVAKLRHTHSNRLQSLLDGLDMCRIHVWYEHEVRLGTPFMKTRELLNGLYPDAENEQGSGTIGPYPGGTIGGSTQTATLRSRRLSILSSHYHAEPVLVSKDYLQKPKLVDREVEATLLYMRRSRVRNFCQAEELIHRAHCDIAQLAKKVVEKDVLAGTVSFKRDLHPHVHGHHHRRSSLGLFDIFDSAPPPPTTAPLSGVPSALQVVTLILSDIGRKVIDQRTETDEFMRQTGQMLLEGDGHAYQPLLDDISSEISPLAKLDGFNNVVRLATLRLQSTLSAGVSPSRADITHELAKSLGREGGTLFGDLQTVAAYIPSGELPQAFDDLSEAASSVLDNVVARSSDVADRILRYHIESTSFSQAPLVANMGIADSVAIWAFCARHGRHDARTRLAELYRRYPHTSLQVRPFSRPSQIFDGVDASGAREAVIAHWLRR